MLKTIAFLVVTCVALTASANKQSPAAKALLAKSAKCSLDKGHVYDCAAKWLDTAWTDDPKETETWTDDQRLSARAAMVALLKDKRPVVRWLALQKLGQVKSLSTEAVEALVVAAEVEKHAEVLKALAYTLSRNAFDEATMRRVIAVAKSHPKDVFSGFVWNCCSAPLGKHAASAELLAYVLELAGSPDAYNRKFAVSALSHLSLAFPDKGCAALSKLTKDTEVSLAADAYSYLALAKCKKYFDGVLKEIAGLELGKPLSGRYAAVDLTLLWMCDKDASVRPRATKLLQLRVKSEDATCRTLDAADSCDHGWAVSVAKAEKRPKLTACAQDIATRKVIRTQ